MGFDYKEYRKNQNVAKLIPFSSSRKKMTTVYQISTNQYRVYVKGASEVILGQCREIMTKNGKKPFEIKVKI